MVHVPSTIAFATLALGVSSAMAQGSFYSFFARAPGPAPPPAKPSAQPSAQPSHAPNGLPTKTVHRLAKPTSCKAGEPVSWPPKSTVRLPKNQQQSHAPAPSPKAGEHSPTPNNAPPIKARAAPAEHVPSQQHNAQPTPAPHSVAGAPSPAPTAASTMTHTGGDGHATVYHILPPTRTRCYDAAATGANRASNARVGHGVGHVPSSAAPTGTGAVPAATPAAKPKLSARAAYILARYLADELD